MLKKLSYLILIGYTLLFNSCKYGDEDKAKIYIGFSQCIDHDIWRKSMDHAMEVEASLHPEVKLTIYNANRKPKSRFEILKNLLIIKLMSSLFLLMNRIP